MSVITPWWSVYTGHQAKSKQQISKHNPLCLTHGSSAEAGPQLWEWWMLLSTRAWRSATTAGGSGPLMLCVLMLLLVVLLVQATS